MNELKQINSCDGKIAHESKLSARFYLKEFTTNKKASIYKCKFCDKFHIGSRKKEKSVAKRDKQKKTLSRKFKDYTIKFKKMKY